MNILRNKNTWAAQIAGMVKNKLSPTLSLRLFGLAKIPLLFAVRPTVVELTPQRCVVKVHLNYFTQNHFRSMYFGALAIGADAVVAILALEIAKSWPEYHFAPLFKNFNADFIKRADTDVLFICEAGEVIHQMLSQSILKQERVTVNICAKAVSAKDPSQIFADFNLGLSIKAKNE